MFKKLLVFMGIMVALVIMAIIGFRAYTKSFSPNEVVAINEDNVEIRVEYSRPYKKERKIFGGLVPYDKVWRTGANEATTFHTNVPLKIKGETLPAGTYSLWAKPGKEQWEIIWNNKYGQWGINPFNEGRANLDRDDDELAIATTVIESSKEFEQFTIELNKINKEINMVMMWDNTMVMVPMAVATEE